MSGDDGAGVFGGADEEDAGGVAVADATDERAASGVVDREVAGEVLPAAGESFGAVRLGLGELERARAGDVERVAGGDLDAGVEPGLISGDVEFLGGQQESGGQEDDRGA